MEFTLNLIHIFEYRLHRAILPHKFRCTLFAHALHTGDVVRSITPKCKDINHLLGLVDAIVRTHLLGAENIDTLATLALLVDMHRGAHKLAEILIGSHHKDLKALVGSLVSQRADNIIGLVARHLQDRDTECFENALNVWH